MPGLPSLKGDCFQVEVVSRIVSHFVDRRGHSVLEPRLHEGQVRELVTPGTRRVFDGECREVLSEPWQPWPVRVEFEDGWILRLPPCDARGIEMVRVEPSGTGVALAFACGVWRRAMYMTEDYGLTWRRERLAEWSWRLWAWRLEYGGLDPYQDVVYWGGLVTPDGHAVLLCTESGEETYRYLCRWTGRSPFWKRVRAELGSVPEYVRGTHVVVAARCINESDDLGRTWRERPWNDDALENLRRSLRWDTITLAESQACDENLIYLLCESYDDARRESRFCLVRSTDGLRSLDSRGGVPAQWSEPVGTLSRLGVRRFMTEDSAPP